MGFVQRRIQALQKSQRGDRLRRVRYRATAGLARVASLVACKVCEGEVAGERNAVELLAPHASVGIPAIIFVKERYGLIDVGLGQSPRCIGAWLRTTLSDLHQGYRASDRFHEGDEEAVALRSTRKAKVRTRVQDSNAQVQIHEHATALVSFVGLAPAAGVGCLLVAEDVKRNPVGLEKAPWRVMGAELSGRPVQTTIE